MERIERNTRQAQVAARGMVHPGPAAGFDEALAPEHQPDVEQGQGQEQPREPVGVAQVSAFEIPAMIFPIAKHFFDPHAPDAMCAPATALRGDGPEGAVTWESAKPNNMIKSQCLALGPTCLALAVVLATMTACGAVTEKSTPPEADSLESELLTSELPVLEVAIKQHDVVVYMNYGLEVQVPDIPRYNDDVVSVSQALCKYERGYSLKVEYLDAFSTSVDWRLIRMFCDGNIDRNALISTYEQPTPTGIP